MAAESSSSSSHHSHSKKEFGGVLGAIFMVFGLPFATYAFAFLCNSHGCIDVDWTHSKVSINDPLKVMKVSSYSELFHSLIDTRSILMFLGWFFLNVLLYYVVPGEQVEGTVLTGTKNKRLKYPINGYRGMFVAIAIVVAAVFAGLIPANFAYDNFLEFLTAANIFSFLLSIYLYVNSILTIPAPPSDPEKDFHKILAKGGNTRNVIYDFFIGRTLNPRIGSFDLKYFCELRPGLVLWVLINFSMAAKQYELHGSITNSMILVCIFQAYYVWDALNSESAILTTMDITSDGFGFMLAFGDLAWVPFVYSLQSRYLVDHPISLSWPMLLLILGVKALGYWIFRGSNQQKDTFRTRPQDPSVSSLPFIKTAQGSRLLIGGWWGMSRHINYLGDILMGLSWCLPCGFSHILPYFYFFYFIGLLVHRQRRDDHKCSIKYGKDWETYCQKVPWRIVPYVY